LDDVDSTRPLAAAILTGGRASRLGGARKARLTIGGRTIIERQLDVLRAVAAPIYAVTSPEGETEGGLDLVRDRFPGRGALGGIYTAIDASPHERVLVVGCDMPFLSAALIAFMNSLDGDLVIPRGARGPLKYEPLCAIYARPCAAPIRARIERGQLEASVLPEGVRVVEVGPQALAEHDPHGMVFVNVNTPHDYERANTLLEGSNASWDRIMDELGP
jgi:molybdopterin-guanine dinucleotide biosynthesis protein A